MTVDELAIQIQHGHDELLPDLWAGVEKLVRLFARKYYSAITVNGPAPGGVEIDDLVQMGFIAMTEAASVHDPERGSFVTLLTIYLKKFFREAIGKTTRQLRDPLNGCLSLDIPVGDDPDGPTRLDFVPDARDYLADVEARVFNDELHAALEAALEGIPAREASVIRSVYYDDRSLTETAAELGVSHQRAQQLRNSGLHRLRYGPARSKLEQFVDDRTSFYGGNGLQNYLTAQTSPVEKKVLFRERLREYLVNRGYDAETIQMMTGGNDDGHSA